MGPKKQEPESLESPKGKETASELADEANETGSGNAIPSSEGGAASSGASVEASEPEMTKSAKKRQRKAEAKAALRGMKTLIGDVKQGMAEKKQREAAREGDATSTEPEPETAPEPVPERDAVPEAHRSRRSLDEKTPASSPPRETPPPPDEKRVTRNDSETPSRSRNPYATATESAAASALLAEAHAAYAERRVADAARLYEGAAAENGAGYAPLMALRAHEGDATQALAALRAAAAAPGAATFAAQETREMAAALGRLFVTSAAARAGASRESRVARVAFPTPDGWFEPGRREETVAPLAARRLIADARPALACGLTLRGLDPDRFTNRGEGRDEGAAKRGVVAASAPSAMAAAEALRVARPDTRGWRLAARLLAAAGRALSGADASAAKACLMASAGVLAGGVGTAVPDPLEAVAESEWALASEPGVDETFAEEARGVVVAAAAEACADRVVAAVAARVPSAESLEKSRFEPDAPERGRGYPKPPAALVSALRALVGCVSATGASGAEAAHGALYRAADAVWALSCLDAYEAKAAAHAKRVTEVSESELGRAAAALASAAAPSNAFGWDPHVVLAFCARSCASIASPAPELADAVASRPSRRCEAKPPRRRSEKTPVRKSPGWGLTAARCSLRRNATARVSSPALWTPRASRQRAARRRLRRRWRRVPPARSGTRSRPSRAEPRATRWQSARRPRRASPRKSGGRRTTPRRYWTRSTSTSRRTASPGDARATPCRACSASSPSRSARRRQG